MAILEHIKQEWAVLRGAPISFGLLLLLGIGGGFAGGLIFMQQQVANLESLIRLKDGELGGLQELNDRVKSIEAKLSVQQLSSLKSYLGGAPSSVRISTSKSGNTVADQLETTFKDSGWTVNLDRSLKDDKGFVIQPNDPKSSKSISRALDGAGVSYKTINKGNDAAPDFAIAPFAAEK